MKKKRVTVVWYCLTCGKKTENECGRVVCGNRKQPSAAPPGDLQFNGQRKRHIPQG